MTARRTSASDPSDDRARGAGWVLVEEGFELAREHEIESLFAVSNGYAGTRGSLAEGSALSRPGTFIAGIFDESDGGPPSLSYLVAPDWTRLRGRIDGEELRLDRGEVLEHRRVLDLRRGMLKREWRQRGRDGRITRIETLRFASLADRHLLLQSVTLTPENYSGRLQLEAPVRAPEPEEPPTDAQAGTGRGTLETDPAAAPAAAPGAATLWVRSPSTGAVVAFAVESRLHAPGADAPGSDAPGAGAPGASARHTDAPATQLEMDGAGITQRWDLELEIGRSCRLDRRVVVYTSRDAERPRESALRHLERVRTQGLDRARAAHEAAWAERWGSADVAIEGDPAAQRALRFACYHLIGAANPEDEHASVGARALTGASYEGHVFWDTEIYMLPFYIFTHPESARALLMYRYHTLPAAREKARSLGYRGALYPWESAGEGIEATPPEVIQPDGSVVPIPNSEQENHISGDVAYGVWQYWSATGDDAFFLRAGAEILLETARFWASRGRLERDGRYHIRTVTGPDEYHEGVDDDAYTNLIARWNLRRGADAWRALEARWPERLAELAESLAIDRGEPAKWLELADAMYTGRDPATGLLEQFEGYLDLEDIDLSEYEPRTAPMDVLLGRERTRRTQVIKQPDVTMALHLLWEAFDPEARATNFRYYEPRCGHGSSLSPSIHALVAARLDDVERAQRYFRQAAEIDLANNMGNAAGGVHAAALGGLWQAAIFGFAGLRLRPAGPAFDPHLPAGWDALRFPIQWRGRTLRIAVDPDGLEVRLEGAERVGVAVEGGPETVLDPGRTARTRRTGTGWTPWTTEAAA